MFAELIRTRSGNVIVKAPFDKNFIDDLKRVIPQTYRKWDPETKDWYIDQWYAGEAKELLDEYFPGNETIDLARAAIAKRAPNAPAWASVLFIQPNAPAEVAEAAYRALSKKYHPDRGGSERDMKKINDAIEQARAITRNL